ncbi:MAG: hypothetical protein KKF27_20675, partial [Gammaproteobacteria bacterium]|nr:hypothetical protein [Gammaproteobacteria bacterium]
MLFDKDVFTKAFWKGFFVGVLTLALIFLFILIAQAGEREVKYHYNDKGENIGFTVKEGNFETHYNDRYSEIGYTLIENDHTITHF